MPPSAASALSAHRTPADVTSARDAGRERALDARHRARHGIRQVVAGHHGDDLVEHLRRVPAAPRPVDRAEDVVGSSAGEQRGHLAVQGPAAMGEPPLEAGPVDGLGVHERAVEVEQEGVRSAHIRSSMSSARLSASGPTTTWTTDPAWMTPWAPAALSAASSTTEGSRTFGAQPGDARLDLDDVVRAAEGDQDLLGLAAHAGRVLSGVCRAGVMESAFTDLPLRRLHRHDHGWTRRRCRLGEAAFQPRAAAEVRPQPHAADRGPAGRRPHAAPGSTRPARARRPGLGEGRRRRRCRRRSPVREPAPAVRRRRGHRRREEGRRVDGPGRGRRLPRLQGRRGCRVALHPPGPQPG